MTAASLVAGTAVVSVASALIANPAQALAAPSYIELDASSPSFSVGQTVTLTATTDVDPAPAGDHTVIYDMTTGVLIKDCTSGTTCAVVTSFVTGGPRNYQAFVSPVASPSPLQSPVTRSAQTTLARTPWIVALASSGQDFSAGTPITLTATTNQDVGSTSGSYVTQIVDTTTNSLLKTCTTGTSCALQPTAFTTGAPHTYLASVIGTSDQAIQATSSPVSAQRRAWALTLTASQRAYNPGDTVTLTVTANQAPANTAGAYSIFVKDQTSATILGTCSGTATCVVSAPFVSSGPHVYQAVVAGAGQTDVQAVSNTIDTAAAAWVVTLNQDIGIVPVGGHATLTATSNGPVDTSGFILFVVDATSGQVIGRCTTGSVCTGTTDNQLTGPYHTYLAVIGIDSTTAIASSNALTVSRATWNVDLFGGGQFSAGDNVNLTASTNQNLSLSSAYVMQIVDLTANSNIIATCSVGLQCTVPVSFPDEPGHRYYAQIANSSGGDLQAVSGIVGITHRNWTLGDLKVELRDGFTRISARANQEISYGGSGRVIKFFDKSTNAFLPGNSSCSSTVGTTPRFNCLVSDTTWNSNDEYLGVLVGADGNELADTDGYSAPLGFGSAGSRPFVGGSDPSGNDGPCSCNQPVNTATGAFWDTFGDLSLAGRLPIDVTRTYSSDAAGDPATLFGSGWHSVLTMRMIVPNTPITPNSSVANYQVTVSQENGSEVVFSAVLGPYGPVYFVGPADDSATLTNTTAGGYVFRRRNGSAFTFDGAGSLTAISDPSSEQVTVTRSASLITLTSADGRAVVAHLTGGRVSSLTGPEGRSVSYTYTGSDLTSVVDARAKTWSFGYDGSHRMTTVTDPAGQVTGAHVTNVYNPDGTIASQTSARSTAATTTFAYSQVGTTHTTRTIDPTGRVTDYAYIGNHLVARILDPTGSKSTWRYSHDINGNPVNEVDPTGVVTTASFDGRGNQLTAIDAAGYLTSSTYNTFGEPLTQTDGAGRTSTFTYDTFGNVTGQTAPLDATHTASVSYIRGDPAHPGDVTSVVDPRGKTTTYTFSAEGFVASAVAPDTGKTTYTYDAYGRPLTRVSPEGYRGTHTAAQYTTTYTYDSGGLTTSILDPNAHLTQFGYDASGNQTTVTDAYLKVWSTSFTPDNLVKTRTDPNNHSTTTTYDLAGRISSVQAPDTGLTTIGYDSHGWAVTLLKPTGNASGATAAQKVARTQTTTRDKAGRAVAVSVPDPANTGQTLTATTVYDFAGRPWKSTTPKGETTTTGYGMLNRVTSVTDPGGNQSGYTFDYAGRLLSSTDANAHSLNYAYDNAGLMLSRTDTLGHATTFGYDPNGRLTSTVEPRGNVSGANAAAFTSSRSYDLDGDLTSAMDANGHATAFAYDPAHRVTSSTDALSHVVSYGYDNDDRLITVTTANSAGTGTAITTYGYDAAGQRVSVQTPRLNGTGTKSVFGFDAAGRPNSFTNELGLTKSVTYDLDGAMATFVTARGTANVNHAVGTITYGVDPIGRLVSKAFGDGATSTTYTYDKNSRRASMVDAGGTQSYGYDLNGRVQSISRGTASWAYSYYPNGQLKTTTRPDASVESWSYDTAGRASQVVSPLGTTTFGFDVADHLLTSTEPNGTVETQVWDPAGALTSLNTKKAAVTLTSQTVTRDGNNNPTQINVTRGASSEARSYLYDARDRLTAVCYVTLPNCSTTNATQAWTYDADGNRLTQKDGTGVGTPIVYTYDNADRLATRKNGTATPFTLTYDQDGNTLTDGTVTWGYDLQNHVKSSTVSAATTAWTLDGDGNTLKQVGASTVTYSYDLAKPVPQVGSVTGSSTTSYRYDPMGRVMGAINGTTKETVAHDPLGGVTDMVSATGAIDRSYDYTPFGSTRTAVGAPTSTGISSTVQYAGLTTSGANGTYMTPNRVYAPGSGQFTASDPAGPPLGNATGYAYTANHPTNATDPSGATPTMPNGQPFRSPGAAALQASYNQDLDAGWAPNLANAVMPQGSDLEAAVLGEMGYIDTLSLGTSRRLRGGIGLGDAINECADAYRTGATIGTVTYIAIAVVTLPSAIASLPRLASTIGKTLQALRTARIWGALTDRAAQLRETLQALKPFAKNPATTDITTTLQTISSETQTAAETESGLATAAKTCLRSFAGTTLVLMADGTKKAIEDIKVGDLVVATDPETGERVTRKVTHLWIHHDQLTDLTFADGTVLTTTEDHLYWSVTDGIFERADQLASGETVLGDHGQRLTVAGFHAGSTRTALAYNLSIAGVHTYHVGPDSILVHNTCGPGDEVHNVLNAADRGVDVEHVWSNGDLYTQVRGEQTRLVRVLSQGNGQNAVVIRELDGTAVTSMMISDESLAARIADGRWQ